MSNVLSSIPPMYLQVTTLLLWGSDQISNVLSSIPPMYLLPSYFEVVIRCLIIYPPTYTEVVIRCLMSSSCLHWTNDQISGVSSSKITFWLVLWLACKPVCGWSMIEQRLYATSQLSKQTDKYHKYVSVK